MFSTFKNSYHHGRCYRVELSWRLLIKNLRKAGFLRRELQPDQEGLSALAAMTQLMISSNHQQILNWVSLLNLPSDLTLLVKVEIAFDHVKQQSKEQSKRIEDVALSLNDDLKFYCDVSFKPY